LPPLVSVEATRVCILIGNSEVLLAAVCKSLGHTWNDADIIDLLSFRHNSLLAGDLDVEHPFWNSVDSNPSGCKLQNLLHVHEFEISTPQYPIHYCPTGNGDMLSIAVHKNFRLSEAIVSDILDSAHLPVVFHVMDHVRARNLSDPLDKFTH
jgi:hypothetical protein